MANACDLPVEIWYLIARYIPKSQLPQLMSLNKFFFQCWMDINWKQVIVDTEFPQKAMRLLSRMRDPFVATRIKKLTICLRYFKSNEPSTSTTSTSRPLFSKLTSVILPKPKPQTTIVPVPTLHTAITNLIFSLPHFTNITSLKIELWHIPYGLLPNFFLTITTSPLAKTIQRLWMSGHVNMFASLAESMDSEHKGGPRFKNLNALKLELIDFGFLGVEPGHLAPDSIRNFARFILSLSPSLHSLCIWNWSSTVDLDALFAQLSSPNSTSLPELTTLMLVIHTSPGTFPTSLHRFLLAHSGNLQHLQLRLKMSGAHFVPQIENPLILWLTDLVNDADNHPLANENCRFFPKLRTLDIYPSTTHTGLSAVLAMIKRTSSTLSHLIIRDHYLSLTEVEQVINALTEEVTVGGQASPKTRRKLQSLRMNTTQLSLPLLDLLAQKLPQLEILWLSVSNVVGAGSQTFYELLRSRRHYHDHISHTQNDCLAIWKLNSLAVWQAGQEMDEVVRAVADSVPSVVLGGSDGEDSDEE